MHLSIIECELNLTTLLLFKTRRIFHAGYNRFMNQQSIVSTPKCGILSQKKNKEMMKTKMGKMKDNNMEMDKATKEAIMIGNVTHILWPKSS